MKGKQTFVTLVALLAIGATSYVAYRYEERPDPHLCAICNRTMHMGAPFRLEVGGHTEYVCCPRCGMHYLVQYPGSVKRAWATDLNSGELIPADSAYYDEGGKVEYCTHGMQPVQRGTEGFSMRGYDRCLPTLVAFKTPQAAEAYQKQHGGRVLDYKQAVERVKEQ